MQRWLGAFPTPGPLPCSPDTIYEDCGWLKGLPGAFPAQLVCEVTGEHERRRHLRQHQRLLEAVGPSSGTPSTPPP
ncbi:Rho guanine nucleotide exchange factor 15 [Saguinus oedipus]|uniref:Rho guanine nucleotide exchange factor 15 n=1 Tax=Saguinus oedipus TaxID=9490 RepID=A0ABQ9VSK0_SAGOE|nr:Rho guanine nucleotide exchange factor 15 [Saguinus oedipus]